MKLKIFMFLIAVFGIVGAFYAKNSPILQEDIVIIKSSSGMGQDACIYASMVIENKTWTVDSIDIRERIRCNVCHEGM